MKEKKVKNEMPPIEQTVTEKEITAANSVTEANISDAETELVKTAPMLETYKEMSPIRLIMRRFFRSKLSIVGIVMIVFLFLFSFLGPVVYTKWGEVEADRTTVVQEDIREYTYTNSEGEKITVTVVLSLDLEKNAYASPR